MVDIAPATSTGSKPQLRQIGRGIRLNLIGAMVVGLANFGITVVLARELSRDLAGLFFTSTSLFLLASVLVQLGTRTGIVYHLSRLRAQEKPELIRTCLRVALKPVAIAGGIGAVLLVVIGEIWSHAGNSANGSSIARQLWVLAPFLPLAALSDAFLSATRGFGTMKPTLRIDSVWRTSVQFVLCAGAGLVTDRLWVLVLAWCAPYLGSCLLASRQVRLLVVTHTADATATPDITGFSKEFWRFTAPRAFASLAQMLLQRLDIVLVAALRGAAAAAVYTAATRLLVLGQLGGQAISGSVQPRLAEALSANDVPRAREAYQAATGWLILLTWPFYLACVIDVHLFLELFGHGYTSASNVGVILALSMLVATACGMVDLVLTMGGKTSWNLWNTLGALAINVVVDLILIPSHGVTGAAIGWAAAIIYNNLVPLAQIWHLRRLHPFGVSTIRALIVTSVVFGGLPWLVASVGGRGLLVSLAALVGCVVVYALVLVRMWHALELEDLLPSKRLRRIPGLGRLLPAATANVTS